MPAGTSLSLLLVGDPATDETALLGEIRRGGFDLRVERVNSPADMRTALDRQSWDLVLAVHPNPVLPAPTALQVLRRHGQDVPFIVVSDTEGEEIAVEAMRQGAQDYLRRDRLQRLIPAVRRELAEARERRQRLRAEQELRKLSHVIAQAPFSLVITDASGNIEYVNPRFTELTGYTLDEVIGLNPRILQSGRSSPGLYREMWAMLSAGREWRGQFQNRRKNGELFWESAVISPLRDSSGVITHFIGAKLDITEHKRTEEKMREQAALLDQATDAIYVRSLDGVVRYWNAGAERLYGWSSAEAVGRRLEELGLGENGQGTEVQAALQRSGGWSGEVAQRARDGRQMTVFVRLTVTPDADCQPGTVFAINTDITDKKLIEARFLQAQRLENLGALASGLAHDLNNVLTAVLLGAGALRTRTTDPAHLEMLGALEVSARRGSGIVNQVLTFARGVEGERVPVQVRYLLREMLEIAGQTFPPSIQVNLEAPAELWPVIGDATQLHQIVMNLCINARDAMPQGGQLTLTGRNLVLDEAFAVMTPGARPGAYVCIRVGDTGVGIPTEHRARIFEPFFTTKERGKGTGLGLATVFGITQSHGGFLRFDTVLGRGTTFEVYLPAAPAAQVPSERPQEKVVWGQGQRILVVDDEAAVGTVVAQILEDNGYQTLTAADGSEAMAVFVRESGSIAGVITDLLMPEMDGITLAKTLRRIRPRLPILVMTGFGEQSGLERIEALGLPPVLMKPFTSEKLLQALHHALTQPAERPATSAPTGPVAAAGR